VKLDGPSNGGLPIQWRSFEKHAPWFGQVMESRSQTGEVAGLGRLPSARLETRRFSHQLLIPIERECCPFIWSQSTDCRHNGDRRGERHAIGTPLGHPKAQYGARPTIDGSLMQTAGALRNASVSADCSSTVDLSQKQEEANHCDASGVSKSPVPSPRPTNRSQFCHLAFGYTLIFCTGDRQATAIQWRSPTRPAPSFCPFKNF
jgi:hypothetical protein